MDGLRRVGLNVPSTRRAPGWAGMLPTISTRPIGRPQSERDCATCTVLKFGGARESAELAQSKWDKEISATSKPHAQRIGI